MAELTPLMREQADQMRQALRTGVQNPITLTTAASRKVKLELKQSDWYLIDWLLRQIVDYTPAAPVDPAVPVVDVNAGLDYWEYHSPNDPFSD
jgi:hypothetical protein